MKNRKLCFGLCVGLFALATSALFAEEGVQFNMKAGEPWTIGFPDGRIAQLVHDPRPALIISLPFQVTENTCTEKVGLRGKLKLSFAVNRLALTWLKHPQAANVGKSVSLKEKTTTSVFTVFSFVFVSPAEAERYPLMAKKLSPQDFSGSDFSWLPGGGSKAPDSAYLTRWDIEAMVVNEETGITENRTIGLTQGVTLKAQQNGDLRVVKVKRYLGGNFAFFQGDIWSMVSRLPTGEACLISLKADLVGAAQELGDFFTAPAPLQPYPFGFDEFSTNAMPEPLKQFIQKPRDYDAL